MIIDVSLVMINNNVRLNEYGNDNCNNDNKSSVKIITILFLLLLLLIIIIMAMITSSTISEETPGFKTLRYILSVSCRKPMTRYEKATLEHD